jgi:hypothetical protein
VKRGAAIRVRNLRLTTIRSFFRIVSFKEPAHGAMIQRVLAIPSKRCITEHKVSDLAHVLEQFFLRQRTILVLIRHWQPNARTSAAAAVRLLTANALVNTALIISDIPTGATRFRGPSLLLSTKFPKDHDSTTGLHLEKKLHSGALKLNRLTSG